MAAAKCLQGPNDSRIRTEPIPQFFLIPPGEHKTFAIKVPDVWREFWRPGKWHIWLEDKQAGLSSEPAHVTVVFDQTSLRACAQIAIDSAEHRYKRRWFGDWVERVVPGLELVWWKTDERQEQISVMENKIQTQLKPFCRLREWRDDAEIVRRIEQLNREAQVGQQHD